MASKNLIISIVALAIFSVCSKLTIIGVLCAAAVCIAGFYWKSICIIVKMFPRDFRFMSRTVQTLFLVKVCERKNVNIVEKFQDYAIRNPSKICYYFEDEVWTFEDVENYSNQVANHFQSEGYRKGDVIALFMSSSATYVAVWLGLAKIGVITALINTNLRNKPLVYTLESGKAKGIIYGQEYNEALNEISDEIRDIVKYPFGRTGEAFSMNGVQDLESTLKTTSTNPPEQKDPLGFKDHLLYIYTSGTTGMPKAAIITNAKCLTLAFGTWRVLAFNEKDILYNSLPLYHTAGGILGIVPGLIHGLPVVIRKKFSASQFWKDCIKYNCTIALYIGEMCRYILAASPKPEDKLHKVRMMIGNGMRPTVWKEFIARFNIPQVCELYGSTEGNTNLINIDKQIGAVGFLPKFLPRFLYPIDVIKVDENGVPIRGPKGLCIRCEAGEPGTFVGIISNKTSAQEFAGYVGGEKENSKKVITNVFRHGDKAFSSGDLLVFDELGYLYFKDRIGDTFRWKGENVSTAEVEGVISSAAGNVVTTVYGVEVGNLEGRAGMAAIVDPEGQLDLDLLAKQVDVTLPPYARPLFIRITKQVDMTGTFKLKKNDLQREGFNPNVVKDALYFRDGPSFVVLTPQLYNDIIEGKKRV